MARPSRHPQQLVDDLLEPAGRARVVQEVRDALGVDDDKAEAITAAFERFVARPLHANLQRLRGRDLAKRNPLIYISRGVNDASTWVERVLDDKETSAIEGHLGTWQEEVALILSGGTKTAGRIDLQRERGDGVVELYAIQAAPSTKNAGSRSADVQALRDAALPLRASRRHVELNIAILFGQTKTRPLRSASDISVVGSDDFWERITGIADFRARLLRASTVLSRLVRGRTADDLARIRAEAITLFADDSGKLDLAALADPPRGRLPDGSAS